MARKRSVVPPAPKPRKYADGTYRIDVRWTRPDGEPVHRPFTAPLARLADEKLQACRTAPGGELTAEQVSQIAQRAETNLHDTGCGKWFR